MNDVTEVNVEHIDTNTLTRALETNGWTRIGGRRGAYDRWAADERGERLSIIVPTDRERDDYEELLADAILVLSGSSLHAAQRVFSALRSPGDEVRWQKETRSVSGLIPWLQGEELISSARQILMSAAKATRKPAAYFGQRYWQFARDYLDNVLMGQSEASSYVVTAYTPVGPITRNESDHDQTVLASGPTGRDVTKVLTRSLTAVRESIDHFSATSSLSGFDDSIQHGVSCELLRGLEKFVQDSDGAKIYVGWNPDSMTSTDPWSLEFSPSDLPALGTASTRLASAEPTRLVVVVGTVTDLSRPKPGQDGTIILNVLYGAGINKVRVRLPAEEYDSAIAAHKAGNLVRLTGQLEREGNYYRIYQPIDLGPVDAEELHQAELFGPMESSAFG